MTILRVPRGGCPGRAPAGPVSIRWSLSRARLTKWDLDRSNGGGQDADQQICDDLLQQTVECCDIKG